MPKDKSPAVWAPAAERDTDDIWDYYATNASPEVASEMIHKIDVAAERIAAHPFHGRPRNDIRLGLRAVLVHPYLIFYRVSEDEVEVVRVVHERRDLPALLRNERKTE